MPTVPWRHSQVRVKQQSGRPTKSGSIERVVNKNLVFLVMLLFANCTIGAIGDAFFVQKSGSTTWYLEVRLVALCSPLGPRVIAASWPVGGEPFSCVMSPSPSCWD